jgi:predicted nuclease of predicted toxin-antitoxin system
MFSFSLGLLMKFLVDECTGPAVAKWLRTQGHDVLSAYDRLRGASDEDILARAFRENRVLITNDKDFGEQVYRSGRLHCGIILLRLNDETPASKIATLRQLLDKHLDALTEKFVVVTEKTVRFSGR